MEPNSAAEALPGLYRAILARVAELDAAGQRASANRVRAAATKAYSRAWDERARKELLGLLHDATGSTDRERVSRSGKRQGTAAGPRGRARPMVNPES